PAFSGSGHDNRGFGSTEHVCSMFALREQTIQAAVEQPTDQDTMKFIDEDKLLNASESDVNVNETVNDYSPKLESQVLTEMETQSVFNSTDVVEGVKTMDVHVDFPVEIEGSGVQVDQVTVL
ncbi:hypothetical protein PENTCL1PPCAC_20590, partial [Pristionchus entomophagus]